MGDDYRRGLMRNTATLGNKERKIELNDARKKKRRKFQNINIVAVVGYRSIRNNLHFI